jgi:hypothetical protein
MIRKTRLSWLVQSLAAITLALGFTAACGDDDPQVVPPDGGDVDACVGHLCPGNNPLILTERGELRFELFQLAANRNAPDAELIGAWFFAFSAQTPDTRPILGPELAAMAPGCYDLTGGNYYFSGTTNEAQATLDSRTYYDVGETLEVSSPGTTVTLTKQLDTADPSSGLKHQLIYLNNPDPGTFERGAKYAIPTIAPAGDFPGLDLKDGMDVPGANEDWTDQGLFFPADFTFTTPTEDEYYAAGGWQVDKTVDMVLEYDAPAAPAGFPGQVQFTGFLSPEHKFEYLCLGAVDGSTTIPKAIYDLPEFPQADGQLIHGTLTHIAWDQASTRFDVIGVNCKFSTFDLITP